MRRYLHPFDAAKLPHKEADVLVVGAGIAGLWTALHLPADTRCTVICKYGTDQSNSWLAQGGVAAVMDENDTFASHIHDTMVAGAGLCNEKTVTVLVDEAPENMRELMTYDVPFDRNPDGSLQLGREGGHSCRRILHSGGDATGRAITKGLLEAIPEHPNITLLTDTLLVDILTKDGGVCGALVKSGDEMSVIDTANVVLATGGIGHLYRFTTNPRGAVGDGIAAAVRAGALTERMEMIQFHPTTLIEDRELTEDDRLFLISEAVRGEGAILRNAAGDNFMKTVHPMKDLAPRDIVTRGILAELDRTGERFARLDVSGMTRAFFAGRFPTIFGKCESVGIHLTDDYIPVHPAQHYFMGGLATDENGSTGLPGLWAVGECACNGVHGANRLASNSMLECLVFGRRAAQAVTAAARPKPGACTASHTESGEILTEERAAELRDALRREMDADVGAVRHPDGLAAAAAKVAEMERELDGKQLTPDGAAELYAMLTIASLVIRDARARHESVGAHYLVP